MVTPALVTYFEGVKKVNAVAYYYIVSVYATPGVANLSPTMRQLFIIRFQMRHNLHKSWRKYFPPMLHLFTKTKICLQL